MYRSIYKHSRNPRFTKKYKIIIVELFMENKTYHQQQDIKNTLLLREVLAELPPYVKSYFRGIENRTSTSTRLGYARDILSFFEYMHEYNPSLKGKEIRSITCGTLEQLYAVDFEEYLDYMKYYKKDGREYTNSERALKRKLVAIRGLFSYLFKNDQISSNPTEKVDMPKIREKAIIRMDAKETAEFLDNVEYGNQLTTSQQKRHEKNKDRDLALLTLMLGTGIRVSECVGLDINDVDFDNDRIKVTRKGGYESFVYFGEEAREALLTYLEERKKVVAKEGHENALFLSNQNRRITVRSVELLVKKYNITPMKKITPHKLRSTYGTALYQETDDIYLVADVLGHKDVNTTIKHYAELDDYRKRNARNKVQLREKP